MAGLDVPADGLGVAQPERGFRYGSEAFWLVGFALEGGRPRAALDLGTGSGVMAFLLARLGIETTGIDVRPEWGPLWAQSLAASAWRPTLRIEDVRDAPEGSFDLVVSNPPYFRTTDGPTPPDPYRAAARAETEGTLSDFVSAAFRATGGRGRACFVLPTDRRGDLLDAAARIGWSALRASRVGRRRWLVELGVGPPGPEPAWGEQDPKVLGWVAAARGPASCQGPHKAGDR